MDDLDEQIERYEKSLEQLRLHLESLDGETEEADEIKSDFLFTLLRLGALKQERLRFAEWG